MRLFGLLLLTFICVLPAMSLASEIETSVESPGLLERIRRQAKIFFGSAGATTVATTTTRRINLVVGAGGLNIINGGAGTGANGGNAGTGVYYLVDYGNNRRRRFRTRPNTQARGGNGRTNGRRSRRRRRPTRINIGKK